MNKPSDPASFVAPHHVDLTIDFDDMIDDQRRIEAENWCFHRTRRKWFRRILTRHGIARFEFEDQKEAALFKLFFR
jgi:hypothetical protein